MGGTGQPRTLGMRPATHAGPETIWVAMSTRLLSAPPVPTPSRCRAAGVTIARGGLAVEVGLERLAEVQEEIRWMCEAAHLPGAAGACFALAPPPSEAATDRSRS